MKTKEFIKRVEELGYVVDVLDKYIKVRGFATISTNHINTLDTFHERILSDDLFNLLVEYAKTPIKDREEEKKYYFKAIDLGPNFYDDKYFNYIICKNSWRLSDRNEAGLAQTEFTEREFEDLYNNLGIQITFKKEEIEEEER